VACVLKTFTISRRETKWNASAKLLTNKKWNGNGIFERKYPGILRYEYSLDSIRM
jgi:hypothetical protein